MYALAFLIGAPSASLTVSLGFAAPGLVVLRSVLTFLVLTTLILVIYEAVRTLAGERSQTLGVRRYWFLGAILLAIPTLYLIRKPAQAVLAVVAEGLARLIPVGNWNSFLTSLYDTLIATLVLVVLIQVVGEIYWFNRRQLERMRQRKAGEIEAGTISTYLHRGLWLLNRAFRTAAIVVLLFFFFPVVFHLFPLTRGMMLSIEAYLERPAASIGQSILNYLPHLGYLIVIAVIGWATLMFLHHTFDAIKTGRLVIRGFQQDWAEPTYDLLRALILLFLLMVSYPHLPGATSEFFKGFSVFVGALLTFGSAGAINNLVSGIVLTYTSAFRAGDMVRIADTMGIVVEKTLLVTRVRTPRNEEVSLPNSAVLSNSITNFTTRAAAGGLGLSVHAGIGYDVDWRTVHALMIDGARKTESILADPSPIVLQSDLGNYAVDYQLIAWTDRPERMVLTNSELRRNVLDCFNAAGVEIMTPSVLSHRDASEPAIPPERMQQAVAPKRIVVDVHDTAREVSHSGTR
ncbi:MAG: mechanosensitive ion channel [Acidobacteriota bacterium]|nr:mechanosensitive ion channel [Acidobacteriota bacterium]